MSGPPPPPPQHMGFRFRGSPPLANARPPAAQDPENENRSQQYMTPMHHDDSISLGSPGGKGSKPYRATASQSDAGLVSMMGDGKAGDLARQTGVELGREPKNVATDIQTHATISQDHTGSKEDMEIAALKCLAEKYSGYVEVKNDFVGLEGSPQGGDGQRFPIVGNNGRPRRDSEVQDYEAQLKLLGQQNKKRLMLARQEQDDTRNPPVPKKRKITPPDYTSFSRTPSMNITSRTKAGNTSSPQTEEHPEKERIIVFAPQKRLLPQIPSLGMHAQPIFSGTEMQQNSISMHKNMFSRDESAEYEIQTSHLQTDEVQGLLNRISQLEEDKKLLELQVSSSEPSWRTLYKVCCGDGSVTTYSDPPILHNSDNLGHLQGRHISEDIELFIARQKTHISFVIYHEYRCCIDNDTFSISHVPIKRTRNEHDAILPGPHHNQEHLYIASKNLSKALKKMTELTNRGEHYYPHFDSGNTVEAPYLWFYHNRTGLEDPKSSECLPQIQRMEYNKFLEYVSQNIGEEYKEVYHLLSEHIITARYLNYLYSPKCIVVGESPEGFLAFQEEGWAAHSTSPTFRLHNGHFYVENYTLQVFSFHWTFDGVFQKTEEILNVEFKPSGKPLGYKLELDEQIEIKTLPFYPLCHATPNAGESLQNRGRKFWSCRHRQYVAYKERDHKSEESIMDTRFMIDQMTFNKLHSEKQKKGLLRDHLGPEATAREDPPDETFLLLLPAKVRGFNMQEKKWVDLNVDDIMPVQWNKGAFKSLVADDDTKTLITALVTNQLRVERGTDLMKGKGTGLIILLHGGPGTGKTLTAESVAEIAEKPLYRVTCGDIGTDASAVEKYLETVLLLGKRWGCVVLLDEADVFLEQRTLQDLQRNALVSVFLRVLEYYDGILILTSNRVGTFDEAFKSRIQLSLHYDNLQKEQRRQVWEIFIKRLENFNTDTTDKSEGEHVDTEDLTDHLDELSDHNMNGRQIRNAVTTARQLALHMKEKMRYRHMKHVIKVARKFEDYLLRVNEGTSDDQIARDDGIR